ncbi:MAG: hypothetical protein JNM95_05475 [Chitinophagaceae bacterium]|nr:hypothetical protein [Chitinophagaceae bacterium]
MKSLFPLTLMVLLLASCGKIKTYTCECKYTATPGVPNIKDITETTTVKGRSFARASSDCQIENEYKYQNVYYSKGVCTLK